MPDLAPEDGSMGIQVKYTRLGVGSIAFVVLFGGVESLSKLESEFQSSAFGLERCAV